MSKKATAKSRMSESIEEPPRKISINWKEYISASETRNYLLKNSLVDFIKYHPNKFYENETDEKGEPTREYVGNKPFSIALTSCNKEDDFVSFIKAQGTKFEHHLMTYLYSIHNTKEVTNILDIGGNGANAKDPKKAEETIEAMKQGIPIIYQGVLHDHSRKTFGIPDIIIRSDWINKLVKNASISKEDSIRIAYIGDKQTPYHYRILDFKFTTLHLRADGIHLLKSGSIPAYKGQLLIYNQALGDIQSYTPPEAYILGRKWTYTKRGVIYKGHNALERLGIINYTTVDKEYIELVPKAREWLLDVKTNGHTWSIHTSPMKAELYPNMCCYEDYMGVKEIFSKDIKELTSLYRVSITNREHAHNLGIYNWEDPRCNIDTLKITGEKTRILVKKILDINRGEHLILPNLICNFQEIGETVVNNIDFIKKKPGYEFFVDFETINDVITDFSKLPFIECKSLIFMIGVGYIENNKWKFECFILNELTIKEEKRICEQFYNFIVNKSPNASLYHWSHAEETQWNKALNRHINCDRLNWVDLLRVFISEPITIKGCFSFGLKDIAKAMFNHKMIETTWNESNCSNGLSAMLIAFKTYNETKERNLIASETPQLKEIRQYNEIDCKVLWDIIQYLRENLITEDEENPMEEDPIEEFDEIIEDKKIIKNKLLELLSCKSISIELSSKIEEFIKENKY